MVDRLHPYVQRRRRATWLGGHRAAAAGALLLAGVLAGCAGAPVAHAPASVRIVCTATTDLARCFEPASTRCGPAGYDLFDTGGRPATVSDARFRVLEARCRR
jgi:hypothetical protein